MAKTIHGMSRSRLHHIWNGMKMRCENPNAPSYRYYGARGVSVCDDWRNDFCVFRDWAMSHGYADNLSIDRIDFNGNYCPQNCRWVTPKEQQNNTRYNAILKHRGRSHNVTEWAEILGIPRTTLYNRLRRGWDTEKALTTKRRKYKEV